MSDPEPLDVLLGASFAALEQASERHPVIRTGERDPIPDLVRILVLKRDKFRCDWCTRSGSGVLFNLDHIIPWSAGGTDDSTNLRLLCPYCNELRSNRRTDTTYTRRMACTPMCMDCIGYSPRHVSRADFDDDEIQQVFCGSCNRISWIALGDYWRCPVV